jgi:hypothetical protein
MEPTSPIINGMEEEEVVFAKDQPQYLQLPALKSTRPDGRILTRWKLTDEERAAVASGADLFLEVSTFGQPLQPLRPFIYVDNVDLLRHFIEAYR